MGMPVVTVASGGMPVVEATFGTPVTEAANGYGVPVTKVVGKPGLPVRFETIGVVTTPSDPATFDPATAHNVTLTNGNLTATNTGTTSTDQGAHVAASAGKTSGKYYFEVTFGASIGGVNRGVGVGTTTSTYTGMGQTGGVTGVENFMTTSVWSMGSNIANFSAGGSWSTGHTMALAVDLDNRRIWFRSTGVGNWNDNAANNPAITVGGLTIPAGTMVPFITFGGTSGFAGNVMTANFGATAMIGAVPAGFTAGWPT